MSFIAMYDRIEARTKELVSNGASEDEAIKMAWEEFHRELF